MSNKIEMNIEAIDNFGPVKDMTHPDFGIILEDGKLTEDGIKFFEEQTNRHGQSAYNKRRK